MKNCLVKYKSHVVTCGILVPENATRNGQPIILNATPNKSTENWNKHGTDKTFEGIRI